MYLITNDFLSDIDSVKYFLKKKNHEEIKKNGTAILATCNVASPHNGREVVLIVSTYPYVWMDTTKAAKMNLVKSTASNRCFMWSNLLL